MDSRWCMAGLMVAAAVSAVGWAQKAEMGKKGPREGIKVHGHWTIEIRDPDGTVKARKEFENSLLAGPQGGAYTISQVLLGQLMPVVNLGPVFIVLFVNGVPMNIYVPTVPNGECNGTCSYNLTIVPAANKEGGFTLAGSIANAPAGTVTGVGTDLLGCVPSASGCSSTSDYNLTSASLSQSVLAGQTIAVGVQISFQ